MSSIDKGDKDPKRPENDRYLGESSQGRDQKQQQIDYRLKNELDNLQPSY